MKRKEVTSLKSHEYVYIYIYMYQHLSPFKKTEISQLLCRIWTRKVLRIQTNLNTASCVILPHYTWGVNSFQDPPAFHQQLSHSQGQSRASWTELPGDHRRTYSENIQVTGWCDSGGKTQKVTKRNPKQLTRLNCAPVCRKEQTSQCVDSDAIPWRAGLKLTLLQFWVYNRKYHWCGKHRCWVILKSGAMMSRVFFFFSC